MKVSKRAIAAVDRGNATFAEWFEAQHGYRPESSDVSALIEAAEDLEASAGRLRQRAAAVTRWDDARHVAYQAWAAAKRQVSR